MDVAKGAFEDFQIRPATPTDVVAITLAHLDSIRSLGTAFYPEEVVQTWSAGAKVSEGLHAPVHARRRRADVEIHVGGGGRRRHPHAGVSSLAIDAFSESASRWNAAVARDNSPASRRFVHAIVRYSGRTQA